MFRAGLKKRKRPTLKSCIWMMCVCVSEVEGGDVVILCKMQVNLFLLETVKMVKKEGEL